MCLFDFGSYFYSFPLLTLSWLILLPFLILFFKNGIESAFTIALSSGKMQAVQTFHFLLSPAQPHLQIWVATAFLFIVC